MSSSLTAIPSPKKRGLGRGLDALLAEHGSSAVVDAQSEIPIDHLQPGKYQPRTRMDEAALADLADSIRRQGVLQPVLVRPLPNTDDRYEIIAGERRYRASRLAGLSTIPVIVRSVPDDVVAVMALIENIQREDLSPLEEAQGFIRLQQDFSLTQEQIAQAVGRSRSAVANLLRLLGLPQVIQEMLHEGGLDAGHARALLPLSENRAMQIALAKQVVAEEWSVRQTEDRVRRLQSQAPGETEHSSTTTPSLNGNKKHIASSDKLFSPTQNTETTPAPTSHPLSAADKATDKKSTPKTNTTGNTHQHDKRPRDWERLEEKLADHLGTPIDLLPSSNKGSTGGKLVIHYTDNEHLDTLLGKLCPNWFES